jgi:hypothetical protein
MDHILKDRRQHSSILDVPSFMTADCDTDHYMVLTEVANKMGFKKNMQKFNFKKLNYSEGKEQYSLGRFKY